MSEDKFEEVTKNSYGKNVKNSFGGVIAGIVLFVVSIIMLWTNEGNLARQNQIANYINKNAIPIESSSVDKNNDNKLISTSASATTKEILTDGIISENALVLDRTVEMYQWEEKEETETKTNAGGSTTEIKKYSYEKVWSENPIDSTKFHKTSYSNPAFTLKSKRIDAQSGELGAFNLSNIQTSALRKLVEYTNLPDNPKYKTVENYYYSGYNMDSPSIGDIRISYSYMPSGSTISLIGMQRPDKTITPMIIKQGKVYIQYDGMLSQNEMLEKFKKGNRVTAYIFRLLGFLLMFIGLNLVINPLSVLLSFIPFFKNIVSAITGGLVFLISLVLSLAVIAIAWLIYRPILTVILFAVIIGLIILIKKKIKS